MVNALTREPQSTVAWSLGSAGERRLGAQLEEVLGANALLLHDRRVPRGRRNIDHLAISPSGVWVIDAKNYEGRIEVRDVAPWFRARDDRLYVAGRNRTRLVEGLDPQLDAVSSSLTGMTAEMEVPVHGALCFTDATWPLFSRPFQIDGIWVTSPNALVRLIGAPGDLDRTAILRVATRLSKTLPPAVR